MVWESGKINMGLKNQIKVLSEVYDEIFKRRLVELEATYTQLKQKESEVTTENTETNG